MKTNLGHYSNQGGQIFLRMTKHKKKLKANMKKKLFKTKIF